MKTPLQSRSSLVALAGAFAATLFLVACQQSQPPAPTPISAESKAATTAKDVFVVFEGPWAIVPDPKDANAVLLLAPKTRAHRDLYVTASNNSTLAPGTYDLSVPGRTGSAAGTFDESILRAKIDPKNVQRVLDDKSANRYAIRLPKPDAYLPASRHRSRVSATYPPEPATEKEYATVVSLRYSVSSLSGFSLAGAPASGAFNPLHSTMRRLCCRSICWWIFPRAPAVATIRIRKRLARSRRKRARCESSSGWLHFWNRISVTPKKPA